LRSGLLSIAWLKYRCLLSQQSIQINHIVKHQAHEQVQRFTNTILLDACAQLAKPIYYRPLGIAQLTTFPSQLKTDKRPLLARMPSQACLDQKKVKNKSDQIHARVTGHWPTTWAVSKSVNHLFHHHAPASKLVHSNKRKCKPKLLARNQLADPSSAIQKVDG
jgi:hypothetical protein